MKIFTTFLLAAFIAMLTASLSFAATPNLINYQGTLTDKVGAPEPDGSYDAVFSIYDVPTAGTALWSETWNASSGQLVVAGGSFSVLLGSHTVLPASFFVDHTTTYLGVKIGNDTDMTPRQRISSVGYALNADNGVPKGFIGMWSGSVNNVPSGWALCDGANGTPDLRDRFVVGAGSGYAVAATGGVVSNSISHSHTGPSHSHTISAEAPGTNSAGDHKHLLPIGAQGNHWFMYEDSGLNWAPSFGYEYVYCGGSQLTASTDGGETMVLALSKTGGTHSHTVNSHSHGDATGWSGTGVTSTAGSAALENRPPYYALAFIMKL